jgi:tryptophanyl-tRNA synthetase
MVQFITPIRAKAQSIMQDEIYLTKIMKQGAEKARASAGATMELVRKAIGLSY